MPEYPVPFGGDLDEDFAPVGAGLSPAHEAALGQAVDQLDRAVMLDLNSFGELGDSGLGALGKTLQGKQQLVLAGLEAGRVGSVLAEAEKAPELVAELGEGTVVDGGSAHAAICIVSRYILGNVDRGSWNVGRDHVSWGMRKPVIALLLLAGALFAQEGQEESKPGWPCVAGRAVDPTYVDLSESTGGQLFLFQKGEVEHAAPVMGASYSHPSTVVRAVGQLSGSREFELPVDSTMESVLVLASLQCRNAIGVFRPNGIEMTAANSTQFVDLQTGRILRIDNPEPGRWRVRLSGSGLFVLSVQAKTQIKLGEVGFEVTPPQLGVKQKMEAGVAGDVSDVKFQLAGRRGRNRGGNRVSRGCAVRHAAGGEISGGDVGHGRGGVAGAAGPPGAVPRGKAGSEPLI